MFNSLEKSSEIFTTFRILFSYRKKVRLMTVFSTPSGISISPLSGSSMSNFTAAKRRFPSITKIFLRGPFKGMTTNLSAGKNYLKNRIFQLFCFEATIQNSFKCLLLNGMMRNFFGRESQTIFGWYGHTEGY
jgi:hypothetical protein